MEKDVERAGGGMPDTQSPDIAFAERRAALAQFYHSLPMYGSESFWQIIEGRQATVQIPLEVLVKTLREAVRREDEWTRRRLFEIIIARLQASNERWIGQALAGLSLLIGEQRTLAADLYADLCELLLRVLQDPRQHFWEENFKHSLLFARKHVYESFLRRESLSATPGRRVPHVLLESLEGTDKHTGDTAIVEVLDERAEQALRAVEQADLAVLVLHLPERLRAVVWLIFWEDHNIKTVSTLLHISTRTVRNRLHDALALLREALEAEQEVIDGQSA